MHRVRLDGVEAAVKVEIVVRCDAPDSYRMNMDRLVADLLRVLDNSDRFDYEGLQDMQVNVEEVVDGDE